MSTIWPRCLAVGTSLWLLLVMPAAYGQQTSVVADRDKAIGAVYGAIRGVRQMGDVCSGVFPAMSESTRTAYSAWRERYAPFIDEMEARFAKLMIERAGGDTAAAKATMDRVERTFAEQTENFRRNLTDDRRGQLQVECRRYPESLASEALDFEKSMASGVRMIRETP